MLKVNDNPDLDPVFGTVTPGEVDAYWIIVEPARKPKEKLHKLTDYYFVALMPKVDDESSATELLTDCMENALEDGDSYTAKRIKICDMDKFENGTPVLSFDPIRLEHNDDVVLVWLYPPKSLMQ